MKHMKWLLGIVLILGLVACAEKEQSQDEYIEPPIGNIQWGMSPEEVTEILSEPQESQNNGKLTTFLYEDRDVFGCTADIEMIFDVQSKIGLLEMYIRYDDISNDELRLKLVELYGSHTAVDAEGNACQWESISIGDLATDMQDRFRIANVEYPAMRLNQDDDFSQETIWNELKKSPLVLVRLGDEVIYYNAQHMAAYYCYEDDTSYEAYLKSFQLEE